MLAIAAIARAQSALPGEEMQPGIISAERPDQTNSPDLVPMGLVQLETGFVRENDKMGGVETINYLYNTSLVRYSPSTNLELRLLIEYAGRRTEAKNQNSQVQGLNPVSIGTKFFLVDQKGFVPKTSFTVSLALPYFAASAFRPDVAAPSFFILCENEISDRLSLGYNLGLTWDGISPNTTGVVTASLGIGVTERVGAFLEWYMHATEHSGADQRSDWGLSYLVANNLVVDVSGGVGLNDRAPDAFVSCGFSLRIPD